MSSFLQLLLNLCLLITAAKVGGWIAVQLRQPAVLGELLAGLLLGPSLLNELEWAIFSNPAQPHLLAETIFELAELGVICLMFLAGLEITPRELLQSGKVAVLAGICGVLLPLGLGSGLAWLCGYTGTAGFFVGIVLTATSVSISAQTLLELKMLRSREGLALLGAAVVDDVLVILLLSVFVALAGAGTGGPLYLILLQMVGYLVVAGGVAFWVLPRLAGWIQRQPISEGLAALVFVMALFFAWSAEVVGGLAAISGAFIAGLGFGQSRARETIARQMHVLTYAFLVPIFFVSIGLKTDFHALRNASLPFALALLGIAVLAKIIGSGLGAYLGGFSRRSALRVGLGMVSRGEVGLIVASVGVAAGLLPAEFFSVATLMVVVTTLITPPLLRWAFHEPAAPQQAESRDRVPRRR